MSRQKRDSIFITIVLLLFTGIFINGLLIDKRVYRQEVKGILLNKKKGSRGSVILYLQTVKHDSIRYSYGGILSIYDNLDKGDSVSKPANSYMLSVFKKNNKQYLLYWAAEVYHW
ncbi:MAG: hypothetical protein QM791_08705 [Ferruginibacter sp.]